MAPASNAAGKPSIEQCPNVHAAAAGLRLGPGYALVSGYQSYTAFPKAIIPRPENRSLRRKQDLLAPHFHPAMKSIMPIRYAANPGSTTWFRAMPSTRPLIGA